MMTETPDLEIEIGIMDALMKDIFHGNGSRYHQSNSRGHNGRA
jgi:hypothetical protein